MEKKLPILATLIAAFDLCRKHFSYALKIMTPWFLFLLIVPYLLVAPSGGGQALTGAGQSAAWELLLGILYTVGWGSIAVLWHWRVLRDDSHSRRAVIFDQRVWFYLLRGILIGIIVFGVALLLSLPLIFVLSGFSGDFTDSIGFFAMIACLLIIAGLIAARLSIALPAIALDVPNFGLRDAWNATTGNGLRLLVVTALPILPLFLISWGLEASGTEEGDLFQLSPPFALLHFVYHFIDFAFGWLGLTVLSLTYAFFVESRDKDSVQIA